MLPRDALILVTLMTSLAVAAVTRGGTSADLDSEDYEILADNEARIADEDLSKVEVRCYCNQPECVPQGYMCRGRGCFTKLPTSANAASLLRTESSEYSGCLHESFKNHQSCPAGFLCCDHDLCNHADNPAMKNRLNKTLGVMISDKRGYLAPLHPNSQNGGQDGNQTTVRWFPSAIIVAICGFIALLIIASLAVRWLHPMPPQNTNKFVPCRTSDNGPPLLGPPKVPLV